jgi:hypothetical protein
LGRNSLPEMPLRQYFLFVGGTLLVLLFVAYWLFPVSASNERIQAAPNFPPIRIHSDRKGPEAVVIDTSKSMIGPVLAAHEDMIAPETVTSEEAPVREAWARPDAPTLQRVDANELIKMKQNQTSRKIADARKEHGQIGTHHSHPAHREPRSITYAESAVGFRGTFAQLLPGSAREAGRSEPKTRKRLTVFNQGW